MVDDALIAKYAAPVPRYTSYPTAPHFTPAVGAERHAAWLETLPESTPLSLYVHVPFCDTLCWFCGCHTKVVNRYTPVARYLGLLEQEIALVADRLGSRRAVCHVHFGGGSPTLLRDADLAALMDTLRTHFAVAADAEIAIEIDPRGFGRAQAEALAAIGVTRASLGVQDLDPRVQRAINRIQPYAVTARAVEALHAAGVGAINLDLIYGLPHQTVAGVRANARRAAALAPDRVALFGYAHVPWMKRHQRLIDAGALPDAAGRFAQAHAAAAVFAAAGYRAVGLDHFARPGDTLARPAEAGRLRRNFQGYTTDNAPVLIGLGPSAISRLPQGYVQNTSAMNAYAAAVGEGRLPTARGVVLDAEDRLRWAAIERIMCDLALDVAALCRRFGREAGALDDALANLAPLAADGLVAVDGRTVRVPEAGRPFLRPVAAAFDAYLVRGAARHSTAV